MGGSELSEPALPPAYIAVHAAYQRLTRAERRRRRLRAAEATLAAETERLLRLRARLRAEQTQARAIETRLMWPTLPRRRHRRLADWRAGRAEVLTLQSEIAARHQGWEELSMALGPSPGADIEAEIQAAEAELDLALTAWKETHQTAGSSLGSRLDRLERRTGEVEALLVEVDEATLAARQAKAALLIAVRAVHRAPMWRPERAGRPRRLGTSVARAIGGSRVAAAETAVGRLQRWFLQLDAELADLRQPPPDAAPVPPAGLDRTMTRWSEEIFGTWLVDGRIDLSLQSVADYRSRLDELVSGFDEYRRVLTEALGVVDGLRRTALLEHPGIV